MRLKNVAFLYKALAEIADSAEKHLRFLRFPRAILYFCVREFEVVAGEDLAGFSTQVHGTALAVTPHLAVTALTCFHPFTVAV